MTRDVRRRGIAMLMVLLVIAVAGTLSLALLDTASVQVKIADNGTRRAAVDYLADTGVNIAVNYLMNPATAPSLATGAYGNIFYAGDSNLLPFGTGNGTVNLSIANTAADRFTITAVATIGELTRTAVVRVAITSEYKVPHSMASNGSASLNSTTIVNGTLRSDGNVTLNTRGQVRGQIFAANATSFSNSGATPIYPLVAVPMFADLQIIQELQTKESILSLRREYTLNGQTYYADPVLVSTLSGTVQTIFTTSNPANVWYSDSNVTLEGVTLNGTLVIRDNSKRLIVKGTSTISPKSGMPGLIIGDDLAFNHPGNAYLTVNGLMYINDDTVVTTSATHNACGLTVNGALMYGGTNCVVSSSVRGATTINYDAAKAALPELSKIGKTPTGIYLLDWSNGN